MQIFGVIPFIKKTKKQKTTIKEQLNGEKRCLKMRSTPLIYFMVSYVQNEETYSTYLFLGVELCPLLGRIQSICTNAMTLLSCTLQQGASTSVFHY